METRTRITINLRVTDDEKKIIVDSSKREGKTLTGFLLWCVSKYTGYQFERWKIK